MHVDRGARGFEACGTVEDANVQTTELEKLVFFQKTTMRRRHIVQENIVHVSQIIEEVVTVPKIVEGQVLTQRIVGQTVEFPEWLKTVEQTVGVFLGRVWMRRSWGAKGGHECCRTQDVPRCTCQRENSSESTGSDGREDRRDTM